MRVMTLALMFVVCIVFEICIIHILSRNIRIPISSQIHIAFLGDSHIETAVNDSIIPRSINLARSSESWPAIYAKVRLLLKENIDTIVIGHQIEKYDGNADEWIFRRKGFSVLRYFPILVDECYIFIGKDIDWKYLRISRYFKYLIYKKLPIDWCGGYLHLERDKLYDDISRRQQSSNADAPKIYGRKYTDQYLHRVFQLCEEHNVTLIFLGTPLYHANEYYNLDPFESFKEKVKDKAIVLDYTELSLPDSCYGDIQHLNYRGSYVFSNLLKQDFDNLVWENCQ